MTGTDETDIKLPTRSRNSRIIKRKLRMREEWNYHPKLKHWIAPCPGDDTRAMCRYCEGTVKAHLSHLLNHRKCRKHRLAVDEIETEIEERRRKISDSEEVERVKDLLEGLLYDGNHEMEGPDGHRGDGPISFIISDPAYANAQGANTSYRQRSRSYVEYEQPETNSKGAIEDDGCDAFGRYVASQLKKLPVREMLEVQIEIQQLLINKRMGSMEHDAQDKNDSHNSHMQTTHLSL